MNCIIISWFRCRNNKLSLAIHTYSKQTSNTAFKHRHCRCDQSDLRCGSRISELGHLSGNCVCSFGIRTSEVHLHSKISPLLTDLKILINNVLKWNFNFLYFSLKLHGVCEARVAFLPKTHLCCILCVKTRYRSRHW